MFAGGSSTSILLVAAFASSFAVAHYYKVTDRVYFDLYKDDEPLGRIVIGLFGESAVNAVRNFKQLSTDGIDGKSYAGTKFHRIIKRFMIQGGDVVYNNGSGSTSIFGEDFADENIDAKYEISGLVSMANKGRNKNGCQFFITTIPTPWLNGEHTIFGKVVEGQSFVHIIEHFPADSEGIPFNDVWVFASGLMVTEEPFYVSDQPYDLWAWIKAATVPLTMSFAILAFFHWMIRKMDI